ncbi:MAG: 50S ribosomal protein L19e [Candidatus Aenigmarchaeota archaeon]|nr:50S ribosomal protein L19e [Candidatus Aenigmarchaeota archaeon]
MKTQKRMAASVLGVSKSKVKFSEQNLNDISQAITKADIRGLVKKGFITVKKWSGQSRVRARHISQQKKEGKRSGRGSIKGAKGAKLGKKEIWMTKIRALRRELKKFRDEGTIERKDYRSVYYLMKGNAIRNKAHLRLYLTEKGMRRGENHGKAKTIG